MHPAAGKEVECFLDETKAHFSRAGGERTEEMKRAQQQVHARDQLAGMMRGDVS